MNIERLQSLIGSRNLNGNAERQFTRILKETELAMEQKGLLKSQFNDIKKYTNDMFRSIWTVEVINEVLRNPDPKGMNDIYGFPYPLAHTIKNYKNRLSKVEKGSSPQAKELIHKACELIDDLIPFAENVESLNGMILTQAQLKDRDPKRKDDFQAPLASKETKDRLKDALNEALNPLKEEIQDDIRNLLLRQVKFYYESVSEDRPKRRNSPFYVLKMDPFARQNVNFLLDACNEDPITGAYQKKKDFDERLEKRSGEYADEIRANFVTKQLQKIPGLIDSYGAISSMSVEITNKNGGNGAIEGSIYVKMRNNVTFVARTQVVYSTSSTGKFFPRYPTTFHDVHDTDGKLTAKRLSEKQMYNLGGSEISPK